MFLRTIILGQHTLLRSAQPGGSKLGSKLGSTTSRLTNAPLNRAFTARLSSAPANASVVDKLKFIYNQIVHPPPCVRSCATCPEVGGCFHRKAVMQPIPWWMWTIISACIAIPLSAALFPKHFPTTQWLVGTEHVRGQVDGETEERFRNIFRRVGVKHPERVSFVMTDGAGPTAVGHNYGKEGAIVFIPKLMIDLLNPSYYLSVKNQADPSQVLFQGTISQLTEDDRTNILCYTGMLIPTAQEVDWIIGHEGTHISHNHSLGIAGVVLGSIVTTHLAAKLFNFFGSRSYSVPTLPGKIIHCAVTCAVATVGLFFYSWKEEMDADLTSARVLECGEVAAVLTKKKIIQNLVYKDLTGAWNITSKGNDLTNLEHPPLTIQQKYLIKEAQKQASLKQ